MKSYRQLRNKQYFAFLKRFLYFGASITLCFLLSTFSFSPTQAQVSNPTPTVTPATTSINKSALVELGGEELFKIRAGVGAFSAEERAEAVKNRILKLAENPTNAVEKIRIDDKLLTTNLTFENRVILTITDADARAADQSRQELARNYREKIQKAITQYRIQRSPDYIRQGIFNSLIATALLVGTLILFAVVFPWFYRNVGNLQNSRLPTIRIQNFELLAATRISQILISLLKLLRVLLTLGALVIYVPLVMSFFPWTRQISLRVLRYFLQAAEHSWEGFLSYLPNLFALGIILLITYYLIKFTRHLFTSIGNGNLNIQGFYPEWAEPTFKLSAFLIIILAAVIAFPYLPGFGSPAFQGISLFLGLLLSLGSSVVVANVVAGIILIYTRAFQIGDRIKIGDAIGDVVEKTLFVTRIRTVKNVMITLPNTSVFTNQIINYTAAELDPNQAPLILHTTVTLGYDVPWRKVHQVLVDAAKSTTNLLCEPEPFVLQTSLDDFYVSYELNAFTHNPSIMARIYSELYQNIQDKCNEAEIEILSPHYSAVRDGSQITIPEDYLPKNYTTPGWGIFPQGTILDLLNNKAHNSSQNQTKESKE
ncbi:small-conductance mechanosensitive channel [Rivularia sp. PCC 7116]|uniref:mechanosensitive ion channel family protein n=1 Tax=Rivularia sp. PCC 7116 TaxID=373994 RepID=UPI00029EE509|nr:mechanosensitive ion channel domain-containing protein [Rivularia sp. PCC 7116]AFY56827.1 small-conductance mechanosensitive channel [Rivularia sp. PCC 7116]